MPGRRPGTTSEKPGPAPDSIPLRIAVKAWLPPEGSLSSEGVSSGWPDTSGELATRWPRGSRTCYALSRLPRESTGDAAAAIGCRSLNRDCTDALIAVSTAVCEWVTVATAMSVRTSASITAGSRRVARRRRATGSRYPARSPAISPPSGGRSSPAAQGGGRRRRWSLTRRQSPSSAQAGPRRVNARNRANSSSRLNGLVR